MGMGMPIWRIGSENNKQITGAVSNGSFLIKLFIATFLLL